MGLLDALIRGRVSRVLPQPDVDGGRDGEPVRISSYNEQIVMPIHSKKHQLVDEGSYWVGSMGLGATALELGISAAFSLTQGAIVLRNSFAKGKPNRRLFLDYIKFMVVTAPTSAISLRMATAIDDTDRRPTTRSPASGFGPGTPATVTAYKVPVAGPCYEESPVSLLDGVELFFPLSTSAGAPPTIPTGGSNMRALSCMTVLRSQIPVLNDEYIIDFGGDVPASALVTAAPAGASKIVTPHCPVVLGPEQCFVLHMWGPSNASAGIAFGGMEVGGWVR